MNVKKGLKILLTVVIVIAALYMMPFVTVRTTDSQGRTWRAPFLTSFVSDTGSAVIFSGFRSAYALKKDGENAIHSYQETTCRGTTYYYDKDNDVSFYDVDARQGLESSVSLQYSSGNACAGWTTNDEVAWPFGDINDVDWNTKPADAVEKQWLVIEDGYADNAAAWNDFSRLIKQSQYCYLRTMIYENGSLSKIIDIQNLEVEGVVEQAQTAAQARAEAESTASAAPVTGTEIKVLTRTADGTEEQHYIRMSDTEEPDGSKPVNVYTNNDESAEPTLLFTVRSR